MKVVVCVKTVPDERDIRVGPDRSISLAAASHSIGTYDLNAIEAGAALVDADPEVELIAMTVRPPRPANSKANKDILARGPGRLVAIEGAGADQAEPIAVAAALAKEIAALGDVDLVLCGTGSGDLYAQETGPTLGALLGWSALNDVRVLDAADGHVAVTRAVDGGEERYEVSYPCVLSVTADINTPRVSSMKAILAAGRKPVDVIGLDEAAAPGATEVLEVLAPEKAARKLVVLPDAGEANLDEFYRALRGAL
jgi:electron transfer flavoprotein beta subunit